jgi:hypothetical protein
MLRTLLTTLALIALPGIARAACGDGIFDPGEKCDPGLAATSAYNRCCNATCDGWLDADDDKLCDDEDVCARSDSAHLTEATLRVDRIAPPAGDERLRFKGRFRFPPSAFVDPAVAGFRFGVSGATYYFFDLPTAVTPMIAARIPGGVGWNAGNGTWRFRDSRGRYAGVTSITLKLITAAPVPPNDPAMTLAYSIKARRGGYVVTPDLIVPFDRHNPMNWGQLETQMALGSAADGDVSCAQRTFPAFVDGFFDYIGPLIPCAQNRRGSTITCSTAPPVGPCRVGEPRDVLACELLAIAAAEDAYKAAHGTYFATAGGFWQDCASLPGYTPTPESGVSCSLRSLSTSFAMVAINTSAPNYTCWYDSTATPALDCL